MLVALMAAPGVLDAEEPAAAAAVGSEEFIRVRRDKHNPGLIVSLDTSIVTFLGQLPSGDKLQVDLVSAVHLADKSYYDQLNERFTAYDRVLYELVAPEGTPIPRGGPAQTNHPVGTTQQGMSSALNLTFQLEQVDYTGPQFIHADLSPDEFAESMRQREESIMKIMFRMMGHAMATQTKTGPGVSDAKLLAALFAKDRPMEMKRVMAEQMADIDQAIGALDGPHGSTLIGVRNQRVIDVLVREVKNGARRVAIFYGAAHMPDMSERLLKAFPLKRQDEQHWLVGWNMQDSVPDAGPSKAD
jgi:hypothetical protein